MASWWGEAYAWRTAELEAGRGNAYDVRPETRVPWSTVYSKFPFLDVYDRVDIQLEIEAEAKRRGFKDFLIEVRRARRR